MDPGFWGPHLARAGSQAGASSVCVGVGRARTARARAGPVLVGAFRAG